MSSLQESAFFGVSSIWRAGQWGAIELRISGVAMEGVRWLLLGCMLIADVALTLAFRRKRITNVVSTVSIAKSSKNKDNGKHTTKFLVNLLTGN